MTTYNTRRKKGFRCLFALVTVATLAVPYVALGAGRAGPAFRNSGRSSVSSSHQQQSFSRPFHRFDRDRFGRDRFGRFDRFDRFGRFGFFGGDGFDDFGGDGLGQDVTSIAPSTEPELAENRIYVPPRWVDGGYGVQVSQPGYWAVPK
jgi:hypothetical protein